MNAIAPSARTQIFSERFDLLVIGGGIVGSGVARDAAMRGLKVALIDRGDFAGGTSSRSSRLLHGGLRYLEQGRVGLVREASIEKKTIHRIAPHLAKPLGFAFPAYRKIGRPLWQLRIGVKIYDWLCGRNFEPSRGWSRDETLKNLPALQPKDLVGAAYYFDGLTQDARLVLDTLGSAQRHGAVLCNAMRFVSANRDGEGWTCQVRDEESDRSGTVIAKTIVNATGPWADQIPHSAVKLRLSKGIHIVIDRARLPVTSAVVITEGKRILFVIPWGERLIIGTTDTDYVGNPEAVSTDASDIRYVLDTVNRFFPEVRLQADDLISCWAGLRPLIANPDGSPSDISRAHQIRSPEPGWWDIAGGKLTTYRLMAEQTVDLIGRFLKKNMPACRTAREPLLGEETHQTWSGIVPGPVSREAVEHYVRHEWALHLEDVIVRRGGWFYYQRWTEEDSRRVANWMAEFLGWSSDRIEAEIASIRPLSIDDRLRREL